MQERLATVGQLAAGIAHDFNNIMAAIVVYTDLLIMDENLSQTSQEQLRIIQQQVQRATSLIRQILDFSRRAVIEQIPLDLLPFIKELDKLLMRVLPENIHLEFSFQPGSYFVKADPTRLQQAIMNLALNGRDAMPNGGSLRFDLERVQLTTHDELPLPDLAPGNWIRLTVKDTGAGIPAEILSHIFDPFFTTKPAGKGTGLGLAQAYGIIKQHDGGIAVHSEMGNGASFMIYLPALEMPEEETIETQPELMIMGNGETILIVEDDPAARLAMISLLESQNYRPLDAQNGVQALEIFEKEQGAVNLVVSDVVMPEMGGLTLYGELRARNPLIKMLFITGHPLDFSDQAALETGRAQWLQKPFSVLEFTSVLRTMLQDIS
jgi:CheY-like chemotaxis protein